MTLGRGGVPLFRGPRESGGGGDPSPPSHVVADWALTDVRYFFLDNDGGSDAHVGFLDAAAGTTFTGAQAAAVALKTIEQLMTLLPPLGAGRQVVILQKIRAGAAAYLSPGGTASDINLTGIDTQSYGSFLWRGSTDLTNSAADRVICGAHQVAAGSGGGGAFTVAALSTATLLNLGGGDTIPAEPAALQYRVRFSPTTTTAALRGICRNVAAHTTTAITLGLNLPAVPVVGDTFFIEGPGVTVRALAFPGGGFDPVLFQPSAELVGVRFTTTSTGGIRISGGNARLAFIEASGVTNNLTTVAQGLTQLTISDTYADETEASRVCGMGFRSVSPTVLTQIRDVIANCLGCINTIGVPLVLTFVTAGQVGRRSYVKGGVFLSSCGATAATPVGPSGVGGGNLTIGTNNNTSLTTEAAMRVETPTNNAGGLVIAQSAASLIHVAFTNMGSKPGVIVRNSCGGVITIDGCSGSTGNAGGVGLKVQTINEIYSAAVTLLLGTLEANTFTNTLGDISTAESAVFSHATLTTTNVVDTVGNNYIGTAGVVVPVGAGKLFTNKDGTALATGEVVRVSAADQVLRAKADTSAHADGPLFVCLTQPANNDVGLFVPMDTPQKWVLHDAAPTLLGLSYISPGTGGAATTTAPAATGTNQKRRLGHVAKASGSLGLVVGSVELLQVAADGGA